MDRHRNENRDPELEWLEQQARFQAIARTLESDVGLHCAATTAEEAAQDDRVEAAARASQHRADILRGHAPREYEASPSRIGRWMTAFAIGTVALGIGIKTYATSSERTIPAHTIEVKDGQTLWGIATQISRQRTGEVVFDIEQANHLGDAQALQPHMKLIIPAEKADS